MFVFYHSNQEAIRTAQQQILDKVEARLKEKPTHPIGYSEGCISVREHKYNKAWNDSLAEVTQTIKNIRNITVSFLNHLCYNVYYNPLIKHEQVTIQFGNLRGLPC